jgi:hypothetical protein
MEASGASLLHCAGEVVPKISVEFLTRGSSSSLGHHRRLDTYLRCPPDVTVQVLAQTRTLRDGRFLLHQLVYALLQKLWTTAKRS